MQIFNSPQRYGAVVQFLHWATVLLVIATWASGLVAHELPKGPMRGTGMFVHISVGLAVLMVVLVRVTWRFADVLPKPEPTPLGPWLDRAGRFAHLALYLVLLAVPVVGIVAVFAGGRPLSIFGIAAIPSPWPADKAFAHSVKEVHEFLANALMAIAAVHAVAALLHHWVLRDRTLTRMLPRSQ